jgi:hypothetical protein
MPGLGALYRYLRALSLVCKLLKTSELQLSLQESRKLFTVYSQKWLTETHTASRNATFTSCQTLNSAKTRHSILVAPGCWSLR